MSTNNNRRRGGQGNNSNSKNHPNGKGSNNYNGNNSSNPNSKAASSKGPFSSQSKAQQADQAGNLKGERPKDSLGFLWAIIRLLVILIKGLVALTIFAVIFNLALVTINKTLMDGNLGQYINVPTWKDVFGESNKRHRYR